MLLPDHDAGVAGCAIPLEKLAHRPYIRACHARGSSREFHYNTNFDKFRMLQIESLTKSFGRRTVVDNLSFSVERGEVLGFLGPNGAGKSTTMRMITGFFPPSAGRVRIGGHDVVKAPIEAKRLLGYLPENAASYSDMTVRGFLMFIAELRGITGDARQRAVGRVSDMCFLGSVLQQSIDTLSKGYRHRTCLAQALIHDPDVLILDEPTDGLDPNQKHEVRNLIREMGRSKAVVFSTHILEEVDAACTRAIIIDRGHIVANGTPAALKAKSELAGAVTLSVAGIETAALCEQLSQLPDAARCEVHGAAVRVFPREASAATLAPAVIDLAGREHWRLEQLHTEEGQLDEVFRKLTLPDSVKK